MYASLNIAQGSFQADQAAFVAALDKAHARSLHSYFTQYVLTDGVLCHLKTGPFAGRVFRLRFPWLGKESWHEGIEVYGCAEGVCDQAG